MNPRAEAALARGLGSRPSLGYPGDKYEMGLEAIEEIEVIAAELAAEVFGATYAEIRCASGAMANLYGFMALARPGDAIIAPPPAVGGHVTHHKAGCAGLYGLVTHDAPVNADGYTVDLDALREMALRVRPRMITIGGSLNLFPHPVRQVRAIADEVGAWVLFDAAHQCGIIAGGAWANPLEEGAHLMTMSTYKSLGGPAGGLIVTREAEIAERLDRIAFPGMTANFDAAKSAALAITLAGLAGAGPCLCGGDGRSGAGAGAGIGGAGVAGLWGRPGDDDEPSVRGGGGGVWRWAGGIKDAAQSRVSGLWHRVADCGGRGRSERVADRDAGIGAAGGDGGGCAGAGRADCRRVAGE